MSTKVQYVKLTKKDVTELRLGFSNSDIGIYHIERDEEVTTSDIEIYPTTLGKKEMAKMKYELMEGIIYIIINLINGKVYIGKTKKHYGEAKHSVEDRFRMHLWGAKSGTSKCHHLANAIRKHGEENFVVKTILECPLDEIDANEIKFIAEYDSANRKVGYNIALGGKGCSVVSVPEDVRKKMSLSHAGEELGISPYYKDGVLIGYHARREQKGIHYNKLYSSTENTPEKNLELARKWLKDLIDGTLENNKYNKKNKLPPNICAYYREGVLIGYKVAIHQGKTFYQKMYTSAENTPEENLKLACEWLKQFKEGTLVNNPLNKKSKLPSNIVFIKHPKTKEAIGYFVNITIAKKTHVKGFRRSEETLESKLKQAIAWRDAFLKEHKLPIPK